MIALSRSRRNRDQTPAIPVEVVRRIRMRAKARALTVGGVGMLALVTISGVYISVGEFPVPLREVLPASLGDSEERMNFIVSTLRLPRLVNGILAGAAFGLAGAIFQSFTRNPLASPDIIGISAGASSAAVFAIVVLHAGPIVVSFAAVVGALLTAAAIFFLALKRGVSAARVVLIGIAIGAVLMAITSYLLTRAHIFDTQRAVVWLTGSLHGRGWEEARNLAIALVVLVPMALLVARYLRVLQYDDEVAAALGVPLSRTKAAVITIGAALAAVGTAAVGPIAFVALIAPSIARLLVRSSLTLLPAAVIGALMVVTADLVARRMLAPVELPVGVVTGVLGGPYLLWLIARANRIGHGG